MIGRIFMAIDNLKNRCHAFNSMLQKSKRQQANLPQVNTKKKDGQGANTANSNQKDPQTQTSLPAEGTHGSHANTHPGTVTKIENSEGNAEEESRRHQEDKIFDGSQA
jgi:hypothetical protein